MASSLCPKHDLCLVTQGVLLFCQSLSEHPQSSRMCSKDLAEEVPKGFC